MWNRWIDRFLSRLVKTGTLDLTAPDGTTRRYGTGAPVVAVHVHTPDALRQKAETVMSVIGTKTDSSSSSSLFERRRLRISGSPSTAE